MKTAEPRFKGLGLILSTKNFKNLSLSFLKRLIFLVLMTFGSAALADLASGNEAYKIGDYYKAYKLWLPDAEDGDSGSQVKIGHLFFAGYGVPKNKHEAAKWYRQAANQGHALGQVLLGLMYETGDGVTEDQAEAIKWYQLAANQDFIKAQILLANLYFTQKLYQDAEPLYNRAIVLQEKVFGPDHPDLAKILINLAVLLTEQARFAEAEPLLKRALIIRERVLGLDHLDVATVTNELALLYQKRGRYDDAESFYKRTLNIFEKALKPGHSNFAAIFNNLASIYYKMGRYGDAEPLLKQAISINEKTVGTDHPSIANYLNNLAQLYQALGRHVEAEPLFERSISIYATALGKDHPSYATGLNNLALLYAVQSRYADAEEIYKRSISIKEKILGLNHPGVAAGLVNLAALLVEQKRFAEAKPLLQRALSIQEKVLGTDHPDVSSSLNNLAAVHAGLKSYADAELLHKRALSIREKTLGTDHPDVANSLNNLAALITEQGRHAEAELFYKRALAIEEKIFGVDNLEVSQTTNNLGVLYQYQGNYPDAEIFYKRALSIRKKALRPNHPEVINSLYNLSRLYQDLQKNNESLEHIRQAVSLASKRVIKATDLGVRSSSEKELYSEKFTFHVQIALSMQERSDRNVLISEAFESSQRVTTSKAGIALKNMAARLATEDDEIASLVRQRQDAVEQWQSLDRAFVISLSRPSKDRDEHTEVRLAQTKAKNEEKLKKLDIELAASFPKFAEFSTSKPIALVDVQTLLTLNEALFTFISSGTETYAFLVRKNDVQAYKVDLGEDQLIDIVSSLRNDIDLSGAKNIADIPEFDLDLAHELYITLLGPVKNMLNGVKHLLVVPSGPMESLPFNMLVTEPTLVKGSDFSRYQSAAWLPKRFSVTRLPSVSSLRALRTFATKTQADGSFKGFGDPVLNGLPGVVRGLNMVDLYEEPQASTDKLRDLPELPDTSDELRLIAKYLNASEDDLYLRERASETELKSADLSNSRVLAFATHGLVAGEWGSLAEPALVFTPPTIGSDLDDGLLNASEVAQLNLNADIVLLSACNTASGATLRAEGLSGLARAFIYAGARSLLVSHWSVDSGAAAKLTTGLFEALEANPEIGRAEALQYSMMSLVSDDENPHYSHPAFWAPFSLIGEGAALK